MSDQGVNYECRDVVARLFQYLDRELEPAELAAVKAHLDGCGPCANLFQFERSVLRLVGDSLTEVQAPAPLRERLARVFLAQRAIGR